MTLLAFEIRDEERDGGVRARGIKDAVAGHYVVGGAALIVDANGGASFAEPPVKHTAAFAQEL